MSSEPPARSRPRHAPRPVTQAPRLSLSRQIRTALGIAAGSLRNPRAAGVCWRIHRQKLSYLNPLSLIELHSRAAEMEGRGVDGAFVEAGCALGGSAIMIAAAKRPSRPLFVYDVFGQIPPPSERDGEDVLDRYEEIDSGNAAGLRGERYYGYQEDLAGKVREAFARNRLDVESNTVHLVPGLYEDTLFPPGPVALAHIDCDWYDSVLVCLERIEPLLSPGGAMVVDDYDAWSGCRRAVDEYFAGRDGYRFEKKSRLHIVRA